MHNNPPDPLPPFDRRFPGLRFKAGNSTLKKGDPDHKDRIIADDSKFDIFSVPDSSFLQSATIKLLDLKPFNVYTEGVAFIDCEWIGADGGKATGSTSDILVSIGVKNKGQHYLGCNKDKTEKELLIWFYKTLDKLKVHTIAGYASYGFFKKNIEVAVDFRMIYARSIVNGLGQYCPWKPKVGAFSTYRWQNGIVQGEPLEVPAWECDRYELIDLYPQVVLYDNLTRLLENYTLKSTVIDLGLRQDRRLDIGKDVYQFYTDNKIDLIKEYLSYDLDDTELLWNFLIPQKYFMKAYLNLSLKRITTTGTGSWWNQYLIAKTGAKPHKTATCGYQGALTYYHAGVYRDCVKFDFSGLYPSIMLTWLIAPWKDKGYEFLKALKFMGEYRDRIKNSEAYKNGDIDADGQQLTAKILRNSGYGLFNTMGLSFNDPYAGATVTAYGRNLVRYMISWLVERGVDVHGVDTDGVYISTTKQRFNSDSDRQNYFAKLAEELNSTLPGCTSVAYEDDVPLLWIPPNLKEKNAADTLAAKLNSIDCYRIEDATTLDPGLSKNYLYFAKTKKGVKLVKKGKFKKRGFSWLDSGFSIEYITKLFYNGEDAAIEFANEIRDMIAGGTMPLEKLQKTVLVAKNWKTFPKYGFEIGTKPTIHYVWRGETTGKRVIKRVFVPSNNPDEPYDPEYYLDRLDEIVKSLPGIGG